MLSVYEITKKKKTKTKAITGINLEETTKNIKASKAGTGSRMNSGWRGEQWLER